MTTSVLTQLTTPTAPVEKPRSLANGLIWTFFGATVLGWAARAILSAIHFWVLPIPRACPPAAPWPS